MNRFCNILIILSLVLAISCKNNNQNATSKLDYTIVDENKDGKTPKVGDILELYYSYETEDGRVLFDSKNREGKYMKKLEAPAHTGGSIEDGLAMLHEGDSAIFKISAENFLQFSEKYSDLPNGVSGDDMIIIKVRLVDIMDSSDIELYMSNKFHNSEEQELEILDNYLRNTNVTVPPTQSGLYLIVDEEGEGDFIKKGDVVTLHYTLTLIDGSLVETTQALAPITYRVGIDRHIAGFEEAILMMKNGTKAKLIIPSRLAYGKNGKNDILPYSTLVYDVEIVNVRK